MVWYSFRQKQETKEQLFTPSSPPKKPSILTTDFPPEKPPRKPNMSSDPVFDGFPPISRRENWS